MLDLKSTKGLPKKALSARRIDIAGQAVLTLELDSSCGEFAEVERRDDLEDNNLVGSINVERLVKGECDWIVVQKGVRWMSCERR